MASIQEVFAAPVCISVPRCTLLPVSASALHTKYRSKRPPVASMFRCSYQASSVTTFRRSPSARFTYRNTLEPSSRISPHIPIKISQKQETRSTPVFASSKSRGQSMRRSALPPAERSGSAPHLSDKNDVSRIQEADSDPLGGRDAPGQTQESRPHPKTYRPSFLRASWRAAVRQLASFPLAIGMLFWIAGLCALGES